MSETRTDILDLAEKLIRQRGYNAFSYKDISVPLQIKNAAVHYHFPTKADLGIAIIERTRRNFARDSKKWDQLAPLDQIKAFIGIYEANQAQRLRCFMGALGHSYETLPSAMQEVLAKASVEIRSWLEGALAKGKQAGDFTFKETPIEKADLIITSMLSSLILLPITKDDVLANVRNSILMSL